jgi:hypothetical protein
MMLYLIQLLRKKNKLSINIENTEIFIIFVKEKEIQ